MHINIITLLRIKPTWLFRLVHGQVFWIDTLRCNTFGWQENLLKDEDAQRTNTCHTKSHFLSKHITCDGMFLTFNYMHINIITLLHIKLTWHDFFAFFMANLFWIDTLKCNPCNWWEKLLKVPNQWRCPIWFR